MFGSSRFILLHATSSFRLQLRNSMHSWWKKYISNLNDATWMKLYYILILGFKVMKNYRSVGFYRTRLRSFWSMFVWNFVIMFPLSNSIRFNFMFLPHAWLLLKSSIKSVYFKLSNTLTERYLKVTNTHKHNSILRNQPLSTTAVMHLNIQLCIFKFCVFNVLSSINIGIKFRSYWYSRLNYVKICTGCTRYISGK